MEFLKGLLRVIHNIIRGFVRLPFYLLVFFLQGIIYLITFEPGTKKTLTVRKARRIRFLTKLKMRFLNSLPVPIAKYLGIEAYKIYLNSHLSHGLQLRDERTNRCAV